jgi:hypothetical protein
MDWLIREVVMTTRKDWLLMALAHRKGQPMTPVQVQKAMFLMAAEAGHLVGRGFYRFVPYNYGPFDPNVYHDLDAMVQEGLVISDSSPDRNWKTYAVTPAGMRAAARSREAVNHQGLAFLEKVVDWISSLTFPQLVRSIYAKYPEFKANSVFIG